MDGIFENIVAAALQARYLRIQEAQPIWPWSFGIILMSFLLLLVICLLIVLYTTLLERKFLGWIQLRMGPNRVGPWGLLQPFADMIKLLIKEDIVPRAADKWLHLIAPFIIFIPTLLAFVVIPFSAGTIELNPQHVSPSFDHFWVDWADAERAVELGYDTPGYIEAAVAREEDTQQHKTWWIPMELDREPIFIPADENGNLIGTRYRFPVSSFAVYEIKRQEGETEVLYAVYRLIIDYESPGREWDVIRVQYNDRPGHRGAIELGIAREAIVEVEEDYAEMIAGIGEDLEPEERFAFEGLHPRRYIPRLFSRFATAVAQNSRSMGADSMVPVFAQSPGDTVTWRSIYNRDHDRFFGLHGAVIRDEQKASLFFFPGIEAGTQPSVDLEEFDIESLDWEESGASFRLQTNPDGGYKLETPDGPPVILANTGDSFETMLGDDPVTVSLQEKQYFNFYLMGKDLGIGVLYILAVTSLAVLGIFMAGFGANNKWSLYGAIRSSAQLISYEVPMTLAVLGPVLMVGSLSMTQLVEDQANIWYVFPQCLAFFVFLVCMVAEVNRSPFDLPEAESELVAGFHTEYSGLKFGFFFLAEYANMFIGAAIMTVLFFGGWLAPFGLQIPFVGEFVSGFIWFIGKCLVWLCIMIWFRGTFPRFRIDQMMDYAWKVLLPIALFNVILTGYLRFSDYDYVIWAENNWRIYDQYIRPMWTNVYTSYYALPIIGIVTFLLVWDGIGTYFDAKRARAKAESLKESAK